MDALFRNLISNPTVRAYILAGVRHLLTAAGAWLATKGFADTDMTQGLIGLGLAATSFILSQFDVAQVDNKISKAIELAPNTSAATVSALKNGTF